MEYDLEKDFLPVGTIVKIRLNKELFMITGFCTVDGKTNEVYDYLLVMYPFGYYSPDNVMMVNKNLIKRVIKLGYISDEEKKFKEELNRSIKENKRINYNQEEQ